MNDIEHLVLPLSRQPVIESSPPFFVLRCRCGRVGSNTWKTSTEAFAAARDTECEDLYQCGACAAGEHCGGDECRCCDPCFCKRPARHCICP